MYRYYIRGECFVVEVRSRDIIIICLLRGRDSITRGEKQVKQRVSNYLT